jgi:magnesium-transporting ATPase (P-type)
MISASVGWARSSDGALPAALAGTMLMFILVIALAGYVYMALALQTIATKTNTENGWLAWIPIANIFLMLSIAKKPMWWFVLCLVPLVNVVILIMVWMAVAEARHKPNWWGILTIVPVANIVVPGYLAWSD